MTTRVTVKVEDVSDGPVMLGDRRIDVNETVTMELPGDGLSIKASDPAEVGKVEEPTDDVFSASNRPNGNMSAGIAPKLPKSGGETAQVFEGERVVERPVAELGRATQGGGPEAEPDGSTPGPQPDHNAAGPAGPGAATGDIDPKGRPTGEVQTSRRGPKPQARNAATSAAKRSAKKGR